MSLRILRLTSELDQVKKQAVLESTLARREIETLEWKLARQRQETERLRIELSGCTAVQEQRRSDVDNDDEDATVAASNLTDNGLFGAVSDSWDEDVPHHAEVLSGDDEDDVVRDQRLAGVAYDGGALVRQVDVEVAPSVHRGNTTNLQSVFDAPVLAFPLALASSDGIGQTEPNGQLKSRDFEGLPLKPKRKRRRKRKRQRPRRRKGRANKRCCPKHSPVTPPRRHDSVRRQAAKTHESFIKEFQTFFNSNAAKYCPASGFGATRHLKGIG